LKKSLAIALALSLVATAALAQPANPDTNGDGRITLAEYQTFSWRQWLQRADGNRDGQISRAEVATAAGARAPMLGMIWGRWDTNRDNMLSRAEVDVLSTQGFRRTDSNRDGVVDSAEAAAARGRR
jgi:hypothetical protein